MSSVVRWSTIWILLVIVALNVVSAQEKFKAYTQELPGTEESIRMIPIKGGYFDMGSSYIHDSSDEDERPIHHVEIAPFWMAKYETTWNLYQLYVDRVIDKATPLETKARDVKIKVDGVSGATIPYIDMSQGMGTDGYPVINVSQHAASAFCEWLSALTGHYYRLPTEAEWEYACRAGSETAYHFGDDDYKLDKYGWYIDNSEGGTHPVGSKRPNPWRLHDMHGNVAEWTLDQYLSRGYDRHEGKNPYNQPKERYPRVVRGGSWMDAPAELRSAARRASKENWNRRDPQYPKSLWWHTDAPFLGFRIVRPLVTPSKREQKKYWVHKN